MKGLYSTLLLHDSKLYNPLDETARLGNKQNGIKKEQFSMNNAFSYVIKNMKFKPWICENVNFLLISLS